MRCEPAHAVTCCHGKVATLRFYLYWLVAQEGLGDQRLAATGLSMTCKLTLVPMSWNNRWINNAWEDRQAVQQH